MNFWIAASVGCPAAATGFSRLDTLNVTGKVLVVMAFGVPAMVWYTVYALVGHWGEAFFAEIWDWALGGIGAYRIVPVCRVYGVA